MCRRLSGRRARWRGVDGLVRLKCEGWYLKTVVRRGVRLSEIERGPGTGWPVPGCSQLSRERLARRPRGRGASTAGEVCGGAVGGGPLPAEKRQFSRDGDRGDPVVLAGRASHAPPAGLPPAPGAPGG